MTLSCTESMHTDNTTESRLSRRMYCWCQAAVHADWPTTQSRQVGGVLGTSNQLQVVHRPRRQWPLPVLTCRWRRTWRYLALCLIVVWHSTDTSQRWHEPATTTPGPSGIFVTCCPQNSLLLWPAAWYCISAGLLQCCVVWCSSQRYSEAAACPEHCGEDRHTVAKKGTCWCSTTAGTVTLASCLSTDRVQAGRTDIQDPSFINPNVPRPSHQIASNFMSSSFRHAYTAQTYYKTHFADRAFCCTAPTVWNSLSNDVASSTSLAVFKSTLKTLLFRQTFRPSRFSRP